MRPVQVVWLKKAFRLSDHPCLVRAAEKGPVLPLYILETEYWKLPDTSYRHYQFLKGCVEDLAAQIEEQFEDKGAKLAILSRDSFDSNKGEATAKKGGEAVAILAELKAAFGEIELWSHQETGNAWTFARDQAVREWCDRNKVTFHEPLQFGVWRGSKIDRDHWAKHWDALMAKPIESLPDHITFAEHAYDSKLDCGMPEAEALGLKPDGIQALQPPGREAALKVLNSFLHERGEKYRTDMSSPVTGESGCSRLSPHLTYGTLSMREIYQITQQRITELRALPKEERGTWLSSLSSFVGRLHWHCHFTQKLELEPELEWLPMARAYRGIRDDGDNADRLRAYELGQTGYPFVDACLRYLRATGWINFRMRAMLMSFASYDLWLPWQQSGEVLARLFTDYEPGIHWPQTQMQSGVTGINAIRIYSPIKQGLDQDPNGTFTRQWVPELAHLDDKVLQTPWLYEGDEPLDYPPPIVDHKIAVRAAKDTLWTIKKTPEAKAEAEKVYEKHGSRKRPRSRSGRKSTGKTTGKKARTKTATKRTTKSKKKAADVQLEITSDITNVQSNPSKKATKKATNVSA